MGRLHELAGQRADGEVFPIEASISRSGAGEEQLMTVLLRDVGTLREAEAQQAAQARAEAARRAMAEFIGRLGHEMRTPLNAVLGFSQLLQTDEHEPLAPGQRRRVEQIRTAGWHLLRLLADASDPAVLESGALRLELASVAPLAVIDEALAICETAARARGIAVHVHERGTQAPLLLARAQARRLNGALDPAAADIRRAIALATVGVDVESQIGAQVEAARLALARDGGAIDIHLRRDDAGVSIEVVDTGIGMTPEQLSHLYEPYNRLGREREVAEGSGIGLVLTRQLVERMHGRLEIDSEAGRGTQVRVTLPAAEVAPGLPETPPPPPAPARGADDEALPGAVVLYVEDNPVNVLLVEQLLARWPQIGLVHAEDSHAGLELARRLRPDLVLLDMHLPDMSGLQVLAALRSDPATASLGVVALSASAEADDMQRAREAGAIEYWTKPLDMHGFHADVARALGRRVVA
jgi:signal transduction histidine kinase/CheY-like chemotaxis protein